MDWTNDKLLSKTLSHVFIKESNCTMSYVIQDLCCLPCQEEKLILLNWRQILAAEAHRQMENARKFWSTWQHTRRQKLLCYLKAACIRSSEMDSEMHYIPTLKSDLRCEIIQFQVIHRLRQMLIINKGSVEGLNNWKISSNLSSLKKCRSE